MSEQATPLHICRTEDIKNDTRRETEAAQRDKTGAEIETETKTEAETETERRRQREDGRD